MRIDTATCVRGLLVALIVVMPLIAIAQPTTPAASATHDPRWSPWLGCWQLVDESVQDPASLADTLASLGRSRAANAGALVCVTPADDAGITMTTLVNDRAVLAETIVADGSNRTLAEPDCRGWQRAEWSQLGARLFAQAELACASQPPRTVSGLSMMLAGPTWIDVQMIESEGRKSLRARRYQRSANQKHAGKLPWPDQASPTPLNSRLTVADVKEAIGKVAPETVQAALVEVNRGFELDAKQLIELDRDGVPDSVIDLMIALSYPKRFVVEKNTSGSSSWGVSGFDSMWPFYADPFFYTSYYAPFGYRYWGYYDSYYFQGPGFVTVDPTPGIQPSGSGRVVDGRGYTRIRRNEPESTNSGGGWGSSTADRSGGSGSSGGGSASPSGYSSGGGGGDRTAQPRPPG